MTTLNSCSYMLACWVFRSNRKYWHVIKIIPSHIIMDQIANITHIPFRPFSLLFHKMNDLGHWKYPWSIFIPLISFMVCSVICHNVSVQEQIEFFFFLGRCCFASTESPRPSSSGRTHIFSSCIIKAYIVGFFFVTFLCCAYSQQSAPL